MTAGGERPDVLETAFWVPAKEESMRLLFHSCNGFSLAVKEGVGPVLWKEVRRSEWSAKLTLRILTGFTY